MARNLTQKITRWTSTRTFGGITFGTPENIKGLWEDRRELFIGTTGKEDVSKSIIAVDRAVVVGDYLFLGESTETNPTGLAAASEVKAVKEMFDLRGIVKERVVII